MTQEITIRELQKLLIDPGTTEDEIRPYVIEDVSRSRAFAPVFAINPETVDDEGLEGDILLSAFNSFSRRSRQRRYRRKTRDGWEGLRIVSEGDSWFQYPILLDDCIDNLFDDYAIYSLGAAGDLLRDIIAEDEVSHAIEKEKPHVFLISGGGNDMVGGGRLSTMVARFDPALETHEYPNDVFDEFIAEIVGLYRGLCARLTERHQDLKICLHGYDYAIPKKGRWLGKPLKRNGIKDKQLQREIVAVLIDKLNDSLRGLARDFPNRVFHVDCRGRVPEDEWHDELHPTDRGFKAASRAFREVIGAATRTATDAQESASAAPRRRLPATQTVTINQPSLDAICNAAAERFERAQSKADGIANALEIEVACEVDTPSRISVRRRLLPEQDCLARERVLDRNDLFHVNYFEQAVAAARSVCKIHVKDQFGVPSWSGTGFVVAPGLLLTNNHVLPSPDLRGTAEFEFEYDIDYHTKTTRNFELRPNLVFATNVDLDFTFVGVGRVADDGSQLGGYGSLPLVPDSGKALVGEPVSIIQHPNGELKRVALRNSKILVIPDPPDDDFIHYSTDTDRGSSGSPVLNDQWQVVALHHASVPDGQGGWKANEGVRVSRIFDSLRANVESSGSAGERRVLELLGAALEKSSVVAGGTPTFGGNFG